MLDITVELKTLVQRLDEERIDYALCGGMAMAVHRLPRFTIDIDILIQGEALAHAINIAKSLGYDIPGKDLSFANGAVEIRRVSKVDPDGGDLMTIDFLLVTPQIREAWDTRVESTWEGGRLSVVSSEGLIALKQLRRSGQDLDDIRALEDQELDAQG